MKHLFVYVAHIMTSACTNLK